MTVVKKYRAVFIVAGVLLVITVAAALIVLNYVQSLMTIKPLDITYSTAQTAMPDGARCAGGSEDSPGIAKEILNLETDIIYVAGGDNPMPDEVWAGYRFGLPLLKNSTRNLLFDGSCFFRSPGTDAACAGDDCFAIDEISGYSWLALTEVAGQDCFPSADGCSGDVVNPGYVSITTINKCQRMVFDGPVIYELADGAGSVYVMHATATGTPDLTPALPDDWTLTERTLDEPLVLLPFGGGDACYYNIVRDNLVQSYHQYIYAGEQYPG